MPRHARAPRSYGRAHARSSNSRVITCSTHKPDSTPWLNLYASRARCYHILTPPGATQNKPPNPTRSPHPQCKPSPHKPPVKATAKRPDDTQPQSQGSTVQDKLADSLRGERATCREQPSKCATKQNTATHKAVNTWQPHAQAQPNGRTSAPRSSRTQSTPASNTVHIAE